MSQSDAVGDNTTLVGPGRGPNARPRRCLLYGQHGIGKSTWASKAWNPVFMCFEDGVDDMDVARFPVEGRFNDVDQVHDALAWLRSEPHEFSTLVVDTADWMEQLATDQVLLENDWVSTGEAIEKAPYGRSYELFAFEFHRLLDELSLVAQQHKMMMIILCHSIIKRVELPDCQPFDQYTMKLGKKPGALLREWADEIFFAQHEMVVSQQSKSTAQATITRRIMRTQDTGPATAKNRLGMEPIVELDFGVYADAIKRNTERIAEYATS